MRIGAVAEILEDVLFVGERRLADPGDALAAHVRDGVGAAGGNRQRHAVAADAGHGSAAVRNFRRGVVRAAGTEIRRALQFCSTDAIGGTVESFELGKTLLQRGAAMAELAQARHHGSRHHGRRQLALARQQHRAALVALADDGRTL